MRNLTNISKSILRAGPLKMVVAGALAVGTPAALLTLPAAPVAAQQGQLDQAVAALRGISTMKADFTQTDRKGQTLSGVLTLKRPGKIRFEYGKGANMLVVSNGKSLYMVDYEVKQVQRWPIKNSPLGALLDPNKDVARFARQNPTNSRDVISLEVRDPKRPEFGTLSLRFVRAPGAPVTPEISPPRSAVGTSGEKLRR